MTLESLSAHVPFSVRKIQECTVRRKCVCKTSSGIVCSGGPLVANDAGRSGPRLGETALLDTVPEITARDQDRPISGVVSPTPASGTQESAGRRARGSTLFARVRHPEGDREIEASRPYRSLIPGSADEPRRAVRAPFSESLRRRSSRPDYLREPGPGVYAPRTVSGSRGHSA
jgi:hypothetical protein